MILIAVGVVSLIAIKRFKMSATRVINPFYWLFFGFLLISLFYCFSGVEWGNPVKLDTVLYLALVWIINICGYTFAIKTKNKNVDSDIIQRRIKIYNDIDTLKYAVISIISGIVWLFTMIYNNDIQFGFRSEHYNQTIISQVSLVLMGFSLFVWEYELLKAIINNKMPPIYACICLLVYLTPNLVYAGRQCILVGGFATLLTFLYATSLNPNYRYKKLFVMILVALLLIAAAYVYYIAEIREGSVNRIRMYEVMFNSRTSEGLKKLVDKMGFFKKVFLQFDYYYASILSGFEVFFKEYDGPICFGAFQLQYISRRIPGRIGNLNQMARNDIKRLSSNLYMYDAIYRTYLRGFIIDFGRVGAPIVSGICSFLLGRSRKEYLNKPNHYNTVMQILLCAGMIHAIEYSPLYDGTTWAYPFYMALFIGIFEIHFPQKIRLKFKL